MQIDYCTAQEGSAERIYESVHSKLFSLPDSTAVYPAHDYKGAPADSRICEPSHAWSTLATANAQSSQLLVGCSQSQLSSNVYEIAVNTFLKQQNGAGRTSSSVGEEKQHNLRLTKPKGEFINIMANLGLPYPKKIGVVNLSCRFSGCRSV